MATLTLVDAAKALAILGKSVVSANINGSGRLIFTRENGSTIDAGDFTDVVNDILEIKVTEAAQVVMPPMIQTEVAKQVSGTVKNRGNVNGALSFSDFDNETLVNAVIRCTLTGNATIDTSNFPSNVKPGTQFVMVFTQDSTGARSLTLTGIKRPQGVFALSPQSGAIDMVSFMYDGTHWYAGMMGMQFS